MHVFWMARWEAFWSCHGTWLRSPWSLLSPSPNSAMCIPRPHPRSVGGVVDVGETAHSSISCCVSDHIKPHLGALFTINATGGTRLIQDTKDVY